MAVHQPINDRRKNGRFTLEPGLFVFMGRNPGKVAAVNDWSESGLGLEYVSGNRVKGKTFRLEMFASKEPHGAISDLTVELIYDNRIVGLSGDGQLEIRRCGIHFSGLDLYQQNLLKNFVFAHGAAG